MARIVVGMSGGVDSSVAALLLKRAGHEVIGVFMKNWEDDDDSEYCSSRQDFLDAASAAEKIGIDLEAVNFAKEYKERVFSEFLREYQAGRTPNPDVLCNSEIKFNAFLDYAMELGAEKIATGHYARIMQLPNGRYTIRNSVTAAKDQTYALYNLTQDQLAHTLMPVGSYTKDQIREIAEEIGIPVAHKPDSQEICFIPDHDYAKYIRENTDTELPPGNFVDLDGNILGKHLGITHYTVGQRKGLNLSMGKPVFVVEIRPETNEVVIGDSKDVFSDHLTCDHLNWMSVDGLHGETMKVTAKIRYSHKGAPCEIREIGPDLVEVQFKEPQRAITPGQAVVFYDGDYVVGGGVIR